jgi:hypothetical protein
MDKDEKERLKKLAIEQLNKTPIVQVVCEKIGIPRATFYRWKAKDEKFSEEVDKALYEGRHLINDFAESQLLNAIKNNNLTAIIYWLKNNHKNYKTKIELSGEVKAGSEKLTPEQEESIMKALELASLINKKESDNKPNNNQNI